MAGLTCLSGSCATHDPQADHVCHGCGGILMGGRRLGGGWIIESLLGAGGMGAVYKARHAQQPWVSAIKVLRPTDHSSLQRFQREARVLQEIDAPHCIRILDFGSELDDRIWWIRMPLLEGKPLDEVIEKEHPLDEQRVLRMAISICRALSAIHMHGVVHRDLKPANVMCVPPGDQLMLLDFGLARLVDEPVEVTRPGWALGTRSYMSPEQHHGWRVDHRSDLYSLGVVLYSMFTGTLRFAPPFGMSPLEPPMLRTIRPDVSDGLEAIVTRLLKFACHERFQSALEVEDALARLLEIEIEVRNDDLALTGQHAWKGRMHAGTTLLDVRERIAREFVGSPLDLAHADNVCRWELGDVVFLNEQTSLGAVGRFSEQRPLVLELILELEPAKVLRGGG